MKFPTSFFEDEVREGFFVSAKMKHFWAAQIEVMKQVEIICRKHGFNFYADYGTMLGAARHNGFIPWDDDLDICMKREELDRFIPIARKELPDGYHVFTLADENEFENLLVRVGNADYITFADNFMEANQGCPYPAGVDIFPLDNVAPTPELEKEHLEKMKLCFGMADIIRSGGMLTNEQVAGIKRIGTEQGVRYNNKLSLCKNIDLIGDHFARMYNGKHTGKVAAMGNYIHNQKFAIDEKFYSDTIDIPFECTTIPMPIGYNDILHHEYGNYMTPIRSGSAHDYPGYEKLDNALIDAIGGMWCDYKFEEQIISRSRKSDSPRDNEISPVSNICNMISALSDAQKMIRVLLSSDNPNGILELLQQCQTLAVSTGETLEQIENELTDMNAVREIVGNLEKYCEYIFSLYSYLTDDNSPEIDINETVLLQEKTIEIIAVKARETLKEKDKVVFIVSRAKYWGKIAHIYEQKKSDIFCETYVMVVPWYEKDYHGELGQMHYEKDVFPANLNHIDYDKVSLQTLHPAQIITQDVFENTSPSTSIHPYFYADRMWDFTDKLTCISPFIVDDFGTDDERGCKSLKAITNAPGTCHADEIVVQSENIKNVYIHNLTEFSGESATYWEGKILVDESLKSEDKTTTKSRTLCVHIGASVLIKDVGRSILKLRDIETVFENVSNDMRYILWMDSGLLEVLSGNLGSTELLDAFNSFVSKFKDGTLNGSIYTSPSQEEVQYILDNTDAYYGDGSYAMNLFARRKKPVMQMDL